ncbi:MAG: hypothetical protein P4L42_10755 [Desulfocapsaceae bacterium]|nr:hypothetical protein [Desulfocapsaceae bacterium]
MARQTYPGVNAANDGHSPPAKKSVIESYNHIPVRIKSVSGLILAIAGKYGEEGIMLCWLPFCLSGQMDREGPSTSYPAGSRCFVTFIFSLGML